VEAAGRSDVDDLTAGQLVEIADRDDAVDLVDEDPPETHDVAGQHLTLEVRDRTAGRAESRGTRLHRFTVDETYSTSTANAVKRWQEDLGLDETGTVVYASGAIRVAEHKGQLGGSGSGPMLTYTGTTPPGVH
jgi:hypothetical protein